MKRDLTLRYALQQMMLWGQYGLLFSYANPYMTEQIGLSDTLAGLILGVATALAFLLQPVLTALADKTGLDAKNICLSSSLLGALCAAGAIVLPSCASVLFALACVSLQVLPSFSNALGMQAMRAGCRVNFAISRGIGSLSFGLSAKLAAALIERFGNQAIAVSGVVCFVLFFLATLVFPRVRGLAHTQETPSTVRRFFAESPRFLPVLLATVLLYIGHNALCNCMFRIAQSKLPLSASAEAATQLQGTALMVAAVLELPTMFLFTKLLRRARCDIWLMLSCLFMTLRLLLTWLLPGQIGMILAQTTQMGGYALFAVASVYYVGTVIPQKNVVKGQTYLGAANTLGNLLAYILGGYLIDLMGVEAMLCICFAASAAGTLVMLCAKERVTNTVGT